MNTQHSNNNSAANLIEATNREPSLVDRRTKRAKSHWLSFADRRRRARANVGIEISPHQISLAILREGENGRSSLITDTVEIGCSSCNQWTLEHLSKLLKELVSKHEIQGHSVYVALGGNACVTRSFFGNNEDVDASCRELADRSSHYLALGRGEKACSQAETAIDAKRKRAWVTVAQRDILEMVLQSLELAGLRLGRIEHTLTALCQVAGELGCDQDQPLLMVLTSYGRSDMFISFRGKLLLDYRPSAKATAGTCSANLWTPLVVKHIKCLRRYLGSQLPRGQADLTRICLPAADQQISPTMSDQLKQNELSIVNLDLQAVAKNLDGCSNSKGSPEMIAAIWLAQNMARNSKPDAVLSSELCPGDMTSSLRRHFDWSMRTMVANFWPIAASILLLVGLYGANIQQKSSLEATEVRLDELQTVRLELDRLHIQSQSTTDALKVAQQLKAKLPTAHPDIAIKLLGRSLPKGAWLKQIEIDANRSISVVGVTYSEDGIYDYISTLKETRALQQVSLVSSRPTQLQTGPAFEFELKAVLSSRTTTGGTASADQSGLW